MNLLKQLCILFIICFAGQGIASLIPFVFPSSLISLILILILLSNHWMKESSIKETSEFLLQNMAFFIIPSGVEILEQYSIIIDHAIKILLICIITTVFTFLATVFTVHYVMHFQQQGGDSHE